MPCLKYAGTKVSCNKSTGSRIVATETEQNTHRTLSLNQSPLQGKSTQYKTVVKRKPTKGKSLRLVHSATAHSNRWQQQSHKASRCENSHWSDEDKESRFMTGVRDGVSQFMRLHSLRFTFMKQLPAWGSGYSKEQLQCCWPYLTAENWSPFHRVGDLSFIIPVHTAEQPVQHYSFSTMSLSGTTIQKHCQCLTSQL